MSKIRTERSGAVVEVILNRPEKLNAFDHEMLTLFSDEIGQIARDESISCVILRGEGRCFSVGFDVDRKDADHRGQRNTYDDWARLRGNLDRWLAVWDLPVPVIAAVHGYCMGGATMLSVCADITLLSSDATIGWPSMPLGGGLLSPVSLWLIGPKKARELSYLAGSSLTAAEAHQLGWANSVVEPEDLIGRARAMSAAIAKTPRSLLRLKKLAINRVMDVQGFRQAFYFGAEWDAIAHTPADNEDNLASIREHGLKEAIRRFREDG
jgi:enoyl-CoA hydratase